MNWEDIEKHWPELKRDIRKRHPDVQADELEKTPEGRRQLLQLIDAKYGASRPIAEQDLDHILKGDDDGSAS